MTEQALKMPALPTFANVSAIGSEPNKPAGSATEVYARVARGANTCWFGGSGPLKKDYIYHAEADAPSRGGKAEIIIHARDPSQPNPRGAKAFRVSIEPKGEEADVATENMKMPDNVASAMTSDVNRWVRGDQGCAGTSTAAAAGWLPAPNPDQKSAAKKTKLAPASKARAASAKAVKVVSPAR